jgi:dTMP kinase
VKLKFYEAGLDMGWSTNAVESFRIFQGKVLDEYDQIVNEYDLSVVNATPGISDQQRVFRKLVSQHLEIENVDEQLDESA